MKFEDQVLNILRDTYPEPTYSVGRPMRKRGLKWLPDFEVRKDKGVLFVVEVKDFKPTSSKQTLDNHMRRAFSTLALTYLLDKYVSLLIFPDDIEIPEEYENIFLEAINCAVIRLKDISDPDLKESLIHP